MKKILVLGAGLSSGYLIAYLAKFIEETGGVLAVADRDIEAVRQKILAYPHVKAYTFDITDAEASSALIAEYKMVVSLLPAMFQVEVAKHCLAHGSHFLSASYMPDAIEAMDREARDNFVLLLNELGLDPGLDHLSLMYILDELRSGGAEIHSVKSFCGALLTPESANNPWKYKFTWNPRNVVLAGQGGTAQYKENRALKFIPSHRLFEEVEEIEIEGVGKFEGYANRDSLGYAEPYEITHIDTILRGTLRYAGYCKAWNVLVKLGLTDNSFQFDATDMTYKDFTTSFMPKNMDLTATFGAEAVEKLEWLGLFSDKPIARRQGTPAEILQDLLVEKWALQPEDRDLIVMQHQINYTLGSTRKTLISELVVEGESATHTAIAKTVGLPLAIATKLIATGKIIMYGARLPIYPMFYEPILEELKEYGIKFRMRYV